MDTFIGKKLNDRYELQDLIGYGSMSAVYRAYDHRLSRVVAVKVLNEEFSTNKTLLDNFYKESQKISALSHANIVDIYDINQHKNIHYIVMEYLNGISLKQFMGYKKILSWNETVYFSLYILKALEYAHANGVLHKNLKPQNIIIQPDGGVKVTDFSIAHIIADQTTVTRARLDSIYYLSPEQSNGLAADERSDLYSLGIMMYEMMTGKLPYIGSSPVAVAVQHAKGEAVPPRNLQPGIPIGLQQITLHAMSSDIYNRYNTATGMRKDLERLQENPKIGFRFRSYTPPVPAPISNESVNDARVDKDEAVENSEILIKDKLSTNIDKVTEDPNPAHSFTTGEDELCANVLNNDDLINSISTGSCSGSLSESKSETEVSSGSLSTSDFEDATSETDLAEAKNTAADSPLADRVFNSVTEEWDGYINDAEFEDSIEVGIPEISNDEIEDDDSHGHGCLIALIVVCVILIAGGILAYFLLPEVISELVTKIGEYWHMAYSYITTILS